MMKLDGSSGLVVRSFKPIKHGLQVRASKVPGCFSPLGEGGDPKYRIILGSSGLVVRSFKTIKHGLQVRANKGLIKI